MSIPQRYTSVAILLHWLIAVLIVVNLALPTVWEEFAADEQVRPLINLHKSIGISVIGLVAMRILWRLTHRPPAFPTHYKRWESVVAHVVHGALYLAMIGVPLAGYVMDSAWKNAAENPLMIFGLFELPRVGSIMAMEPGAREAVHHLMEEVHEISAYALIALVALHILGALKHQWLDKESELQRMWFGK